MKYQLPNQQNVVGLSSQKLRSPISCDGELPKKRNWSGGCGGEDGMPVRWIVMLAVLKFNYPIFSNSLPGITWPTSFVWQSLSLGYRTGTIGTKLENPCPLLPAALTERSDPWQRK